MDVELYFVVVDVLCIRMKISLSDFGENLLIVEDFKHCSKIGHSEIRFLIFKMDS